MHFAYKKSIESVTKIVLIFLPGNPGLPAFYEIFLSKIHNDLSYLDIWCPSYVEMIVSLDELIDQLVAFVDILTSKYTKDTKFIIGGHSLGSYLTVQVMKKRPRLNVVKIISLFPSLQFMADTPRGMQVSPITSQVPRTLISFAAWWFSLMPQPILRFIIWLITGLPDHAVNTISKHLLIREHAKSSLYLGNCEMRDIRELELEVMRKYQHLWTIYFGKGDGWCPAEHVKDISERLDLEKNIQCEENIDHAFVLEDSLTMARKMVEWIKQSS